MLKNRVFAVASAAVVASLILDSAHAASPGRNGSLAVLREVGGAPPRIWFVDPETGAGTDFSLLLPLPATGSYQAPSFSADGKRIAFNFREAQPVCDNPEDTSGVYVANVDGTGLRKVASIRYETRYIPHASCQVWGVSFESAPTTTWSPAGDKLAIPGIANEIDPTTGDPLGRTGIFVLNLEDAAPPSLIQESPTGYSDVRWSPDGLRIAFTEGLVQSEGDNMAIFTIDPGGTDRQRLTNHSCCVVETGIDWAPDGSRLVFGDDRAEPHYDPNTGIYGSGRLDLYEVVRNGGTPVRLTESHDPWAKLSPIWSPDGARIAYVDCQITGAGGCELKVLDRASGTSISLLPFPDSGIPQAWQPLPNSFAGFFRPVDNPPAVNIVKAGQTVPVKFSLGGDLGLAILADGSPSTIPATCSTFAPQTGPGEPLAAPASLSYDPRADQYQFQFRTERAWRGTCRILNIRLNDGSAHQAWFQFK
jgi:Tol biopolymer transport system component